MKYSTKLSDTVHVMLSTRKNLSPAPQLQKVSIQIPALYASLC